jgi:predicted kinase
MDIQDIIHHRKTVDHFIEMMGTALPLLKDLKTTPQDHIWHAEGDVHIHTDMVLKEIYDLIENEASYLSDDNKFVLIMSALLHDIAKPVVTKTAFLEREKRECVIAPRHEVQGVSYLSHKLNLFDISVENQKKILALVGYHQVPKLLVIKDKNEWHYKDLSKKAPCELFYWLEIADMKGRTCADLENQLEYLELFRLYSEQYECFEKRYEGKISENDYVNYKGWKALLNGDIFMPEEAESKYFNHQNEHSHLVVMTGLSGVGKSSYIEEHYHDYLKISLDNIREELGDRQDMSNEAEVLRIAKDRLKIALAKKENIVYDATNVRKDFRAKVLDIGEAYHALTEIVYIKDSLDNVLQRDANRTYSVGKNVILSQDYRFECPEMDEADKLTVVHVSNLQKLKKTNKLSKNKLM